MASNFPLFLNHSRMNILETEIHNCFLRDNFPESGRSGYEEDGTHSEVLKYEL